MKTLKIKKILVPFDLNSEFVNALKMAIGIARKAGADITLLSTVGIQNVFISEYMVTCLVPTYTYHSLIEEKKNNILQFLREEGFSLSEIETKVELGSLYENILGQHKKEEYDLIVVPDFNKKAFQRIFAEINPVELMKETKTAVIGVNRKINLFSLKKIVLPIRNVENWNDKIPFVSALAKISGAEVLIVGTANVISKVKINNIEMKIKLCEQHFERNNIRFQVERIFGHGDPSWDIALYSKYKSADLIVVSPQVHYPIFNSILNNNLYSKLNSKINIPIMGVTLR